MHPSGEFSEQDDSCEAAVPPALSGRASRTQITSDISRFYSALCEFPSRKAFLPLCSRGDVLDTDAVAPRPCRTLRMG